jgi:hypothetical protein
VLRLSLESCALSLGSCALSLGSCALSLGSCALSLESCALSLSKGDNYFATILPGLKFRPGSIAVNSPSIMCTPGAEMSCSSHAACSVPTA